MLEVETFWNSKFQMTSDGEIIKIKVIDLKKLYNFIVDNLFIWIRLGILTHQNRISIRA